MRKNSVLKNRDAMNAIYIGVLCSVSYLAIYFVRNILSTVTPGMIEQGYTEEYIGTISSVYFTAYAIGQLINGIIGNRVKAKYMICTGLLMAGITNFLFPHLSDVLPVSAALIYGISGYFLSMIYGPMTKVIAENTKPIYAVRCNLGFTFASFFGTPLAGVAAAVFAWQSVFLAGSAFLVVMTAVCAVVFIIYEKKRIITYNNFCIDKKEKAKGKLRTLLERKIVKYTFLAIVTGIVRTTVVFWMPTYISQYLEFGAERSAVIFTAATFVISFTAFIAVFIYERLKRNMELTVISMFTASALLFALVYAVNRPAANIVFLVLAIMSGNGAYTVLVTSYLPSLRDTGMVSGVTGFLDFIGYMAAAFASKVFANAVSDIGWGNLILVWCALMVTGLLISVPYKKKNVK